jgi:hypothetical protein
LQSRLHQHGDDANLPKGDHKFRVPYEKATRVVEAAFLSLDGQNERDQQHAPTPLSPKVNERCERVDAGSLVVDGVPTTRTAISHEPHERVDAVSLFAVQDEGMCHRNGDARSVNVLGNGPGAPASSKDLQLSERVEMSYDEGGTSSWQPSYSAPVSLSEF